MDFADLTDQFDLALRMVLVLAGCLAGLVAGSFIYYVYFEDRVLTGGSNTSLHSGHVLHGSSVVFFLLAVLALYFEVLPVFVVTIFSMVLIRLLWAIGDGMCLAGRMWQVLQVLDSDDKPLRQFIDSATRFREIQGLRRLARTMYHPDSVPLIKLEQIIKAALD